MLQTRLVQFATEVFQSSVPLMTNKFLEPAVKKLVIASSHVGASNTEIVNDEPDDFFYINLQSVIIDLQETQYWMQTILNVQPDSELAELEKETKELLRITNAMRCEAIAV